MWDRLVDNLLFPLIAGFVLWLFDRSLARRRTVGEISKIEKRERARGENESRISNLVKSFFKEPITLYTVIISFAITIPIVLEAMYPVLVENATKVGFSYTWLEQFPVFVTRDDRIFVLQFIESFGSIYGLLLVSGFIIAWVQLNQIAQIFDKEATSIKILHDSFMALDNKSFLHNKIVMVAKLVLYARHVLKYYSKEHLDESRGAKSIGDSILQAIRRDYLKLLPSATKTEFPVHSVVAGEILQRFNDVTKLREERISFLENNLFQIFRVFLIISSILWIVPFYFSDFQNGLFGSLLKLALTLLVIFTLATVDDMNDPFFGVWHISSLAWRQAKEELKLSFSDLQRVKRAALKESEKKTRRQSK